MEKLFPDLDADILSLNEVQFHYHQKLMQNTKLREKYPYITQWPESLRSHYWAHGGAILSKYPMEVFFHETKVMLFSLIDFPNGISVIIVNTHLAHGETDHENRVRQLNHLNEKLKSLCDNSEN